MAKKLAIALLLMIWGTKVSLSQEKLTVLSYNVLKGLQQDSVNHKTYINWVDSLSPDIVAYQEMNDFSQKTLEAFTAKYGHPYAIQSKLEGFPVALSSKYPIINVQKVVDNMWHAYIYAQIKDLHVFVIHFSPFSYQKRQHEVRQILAHAATLPTDSKIIIMGDFNSLSDSDRVQYTQDMLVQMRENEKKNAHIRNLNKDEIDYTVINNMVEAGFKDAFRLKNEQFKPSVPTKRYGKPARRIDFVWVNPNLASSVLRADIIHDAVTDQISDHYPVIVELKP